MPSKLSVCIPTHGRRADVLRGAMMSVLNQVDGPLHHRLEICVSDNASTDETAAMVGDLKARSPVPIVYSRNEVNVGLAGNMMRVVELASGDFCWLLGSDDEVVEGGLEHALGLIDRFPRVSGFCVSWANFSADMRARVEGDATEHWTPPHTTREYHGLHEVIDGVGLMWGYISTNVVHRERWLAAARGVGGRAEAHPTWPQLAIMGEMARQDPAWVFSPHVVVQNRTASGWMYELGRAGGRDHAKMHIDLIDGIDAVLAELIGKGTPLHRKLMTRMYWMVASGRVVSHIKGVQGGAGPRELQLARSAAQAFWWLPAFWTDAAPRLLVPGAVVQRVPRRRTGSAPLRPAACRTQLEAELPATFPSRRMLHLKCSVRNRGTERLISAGRHPVRLAYRWFDRSGALVLEGLRADLPRPLRPGARVRLTLPLLTPWDEGSYELRVALVQEHVHWFDDVDAGNGVQVRVDVRHPPWNLLSLS